MSEKSHHRAELKSKDQTGRWRSSSFFSIINSLKASSLSPEKANPISSVGLPLAEGGAWRVPTAPGGWWMVTSALWGECSGASSISTSWGKRGPPESCPSRREVVVRDRDGATVVVAKTVAVVVAVVVAAARPALSKGVGCAATPDVAWEHPDTH